MLAWYRRRESRVLTGLSRHRLLIKKVALLRAGHFLCHELLSAGAVLPAPGRFISVMAVVSKAGRLSR